MRETMPADFISRRLIAGRRRLRRGLRAIRRALGEPPDVQRAAREQAKREKKLRRASRDDPEAAAAAYFLFNGESEESRANFEPAMIARAVELGYLSWPEKIADELRGRDVLDVGCGTGLHAIGFLVFGVKSYTGLDPKVDLDRGIGKNLREHTREPFGWTPRQVIERLPRVSLIPGQFEDVAPDLRFDLAVLHNVTEHLLDIAGVFEGVWQRLRPDGHVIFNHHNFYCWNGHHKAPKYVRDIDRADPQQGGFVDWNHLIPDPAKDQMLDGKLNRIRLDELFALTARYFEIGQWLEDRIEPNRGAGRLTPAIRARFPQYTKRDLTTQGVLCKARRREVPLDRIRVQT